MGGILVADDDPSFRESIAQLLQDRGYDVIHAETGAAAKHVCMHDGVDLVVADIHMPGNNRLEMIEALELLDPIPPVILVTGYPSVETAAASLKLPVKAYLLKPIDHAALLREVESALGGDTLRADRIDGQLTSMGEHWGLTARQTETLSWIVRGLANKEIAGHLGCQLRTVEAHVTALLEKSGADSRTELIARFWTR
jgi:DNA-binding NarL/FixJ family response regulator